MDRKRLILVGKIVAILSIIPAFVVAFSAGPIAGVTGVPGEVGTCANAGCHVGTPVNGGGGRVEISFPSGLNYTPGVRQRLTVTVTDDQARVYGFQVTARPVNNLRGAHAGTFTPGDEQQRVLCASLDLLRERPRTGADCPTDMPLEFLEHNSPKSTGMFVFDWTPPAMGVGEIRIFVAANAANGNGQESGDRIYTTNSTLTPQATIGPRPTISSSGGVKTDGSFRDGVVSGSWTAIFGENLAPGPGRIWRDAEIVEGRLPTSLDGVSVNINGTPAAVFFISPTQLNVQAPTDDAVGPVQVEVVRDGQRSEPVAATMMRVNPGFFMFDPENRRYIAGVHTDGTFLGRSGLFGAAVTTRPARPNDIVMLFGTGFGPTDPAVSAGQVFSGAAPLTTPFTLRIGGVQAQVTFGGLSGAGLYQFNVGIPEAVPDGDQPVVIEIGGVSTQDNAFITIQR